MHPEAMGGLAEHVASGGPLFFDPSNKAKIMEGLDKVLEAMSTAHMSSSDVMIKAVAGLVPNARPTELHVNDHVYKLSWAMTGAGRNTIAVSSDSGEPMTFSSKEDAYARLPALVAKQVPSLLADDSVPLSSATVDMDVMHKVFQVVDGVRAIMQSGMQVYIPKKTLADIAASFVIPHADEAAAPAPEQPAYESAEIAADQGGALGYEGEGAGY
jgi:hypothetical protein